MLSGARAAVRMNLHDLLLAFTALEDGTQAALRRQARHGWETRETGPNVRHERRRKGREAAFVTSARWRG